MASESGESGIKKGRSWKRRKSQKISIIREVREEIIIKKYLYEKAIEKKRKYEEKINKLLEERSELFERYKQLEEGRSASTAEIPKEESCEQCGKLSILNKTQWGRVCDTCCGF